MYELLLESFAKSKKPHEIIVVGLGFMGFGFISYLSKIKGIKVALLVSRRPQDAVSTLNAAGIKSKVAKNIREARNLMLKGYLPVSDNLDLIGEHRAKLLLEMTGTIAYATDVSLRALASGKDLVTMNPELQDTVGTELKRIADSKNLIISDVVGDQPGSLSRMISQARLMGFEVLVAGNMKRYLDVHATQEKMAPWAQDKGLAVRQTTSFTDGTKQAIEMSLVANYFGFSIAKGGMLGPRVRTIHDALDKFEMKKIKSEGIVDYVIGKKLFPGIFLIVKHNDINQPKYLSYLGLGNGPFHILFEPYHLCHLEILTTIGQVIFFRRETINSGRGTQTKTIAFCKFNLKKGALLDGIGGDTVYGKIEHAKLSKTYLSVGLTDGAKLKRGLKQDEPIKLSDVEIPVNSATRLLKLA